MGKKIALFRKMNVFVIFLIFLLNITIIWISFENEIYLGDLFYHNTNNFFYWVPYVPKLTWLILIIFVTTILLEKINKKFRIWS